MRVKRLRNTPAAAVSGCLALSLAAALAVGLGGSAAARPSAGQPPACAPPSTPAPAEPTTITTIEQAYYCIFGNYYSGPVLDDRVLLTGAFAGFTQELETLGLDRADATLPALSGNRDSDWAAFGAVYQKVAGELRASPAERQAIAAATMNAMVASLHDNHAHWQYPQQPPPGYQPGDAYGLGIMTSPIAPLASAAPQEALPPLFISVVAAGSPAATAGLRPGDVIDSVNGAPPFADGVVSGGAMNLLAQPGGPVRLTLHRPATGRTWTVRLAPALYKAPAQAVSSRLLDGDTAYVQLPGFYAGSAGQVLQAIAALGKGRTLRGVILDLRGNTGGSPAEDARLLGAFEHGQPWSYGCDVAGQCTANYPDPATPLLHLPLTVLTDRNCASGCDAFSGAVKDLHLGALIGTRTSGIVAGPATGRVLDDGSEVILPAKHELSANHEIINGIGVAPDYYIPLTAQDVSTGHDPDVAKALSLLGH